MKVKITRIDKDLPLPQYHSDGAVAFDFIARITTKVPHHSFVKIPANVIIKTPPGFMLMVPSRSSTPFKKGLIPAHGVGIGDQDFCGPEDEYQIPVYNVTDQEVVVERGERLTQGIFVPIEKAEWEEVDLIDKPSRGGFGSTDKLGDK